LIPANGLVSVIVPNAWLNNLFLADVRKHLLSNCHFDEVVTMPENTFEQAGVDTVIVSYSKTRAKKSTRLVDCREGQFYLRGTADQDEWLRSENSMINVFTSDIVHRLLTKVQKSSVPLESFTDIARGVGVYHKRVGHTPEIIAADPYQAEVKKDDTFVPYLRGKNVKSWSVEWNGDSFISYGKWLAEPREPKYFIGSRIVLRQIPAERLVATIIDEQFITDQSVFIAKFNPDQPALSRHGVLAAISSSLLSFYFRYSSSEFDRLFPKLKLQHFKSLPIARQIITGHPQLETLGRDRLGASQQLQNVSSSFLTLLRTKYTLLTLSRALENWPSLDFKGFLKELKKALASAKASDGAKKEQLSLAEEAEWLSYFTAEQAKAQALQAQIAKTDKEIDALVYQLYGLTKEEVKVVEGKG
ncbi:MAG TPA: TaqI-like C-terminal specificity domain-containing protein, partial [Flavobacteriales bacterium]|nr:TaqI-like C-terminal specificity domain-containing protein [Flavobacteriales bacterium]